MNEENKQNKTDENVKKDDQPTNKNNTETNSESSNEKSDRMQQVAEKAKEYMRQHWKTGAMILGVGLVARLLMKRRKA